MRPRPGVLLRRSGSRPGVQPPWLVGSLKTSVLLVEQVAVGRVFVLGGLLFLALGGTPSPAHQLVAVVVDGNGDTTCKEARGSEAQSELSAGPCLTSPRAFKIWRMRPAFSWLIRLCLYTGICSVRKLVESFLTLFLSSCLLLRAYCRRSAPEYPGSRQTGWRHLRSPAPCACRVYAITSPPSTAYVAEAKPFVVIDRKRRVGVFVPDALGHVLATHSLELRAQRLDDLRDRAGLDFSIEACAVL